MSSWHDIPRRPVVKQYGDSSMPKAFSSCSIAVGICHTDFNEYDYLEGFISLLKLTIHVIIYTLWAQQHKPQSASNGDIFHDS